MGRECQVALATLRPCASSQVGSKGEHDNTELIGSILKLRQEKAEILGHKHFADLSIARRMAKSGAKASQFVENLHDRIEDAFQRVDIPTPRAVTGIDGRHPLRFELGAHTARRPYLPCDQSLLTGSRDPATIAFYEGVGFEQNKTGFQVRRLPVRPD